MIRFYRCLIGPELYQIYPSTGKTRILYEKNTAEKLDTIVFSLCRVIIEIFRIIWPLVLIDLYWRDAFNLNGLFAFLDYVPYVTIFLFYCKFIQAIGRLLNPDYQIFIDEFYQVKSSVNVELRQKFLSKYDFSLSQWSPDYTVASTPISVRSNHHLRSNNVLDRFLHYPLLWLGYLCIHLFGRRLIFPGSLQLLQYFSSRSLWDGRMNLTVSNRGQRAMIRTADHHRIDTMFIDRRHSTKNGHFLVITCEGNAGFYERGCMITPLSRGYSVLGWNRPGFGQSSGSPSVQGEINGIDAVMKYAIHRLGFPVDRIVLYAWSIGGYAACWTGVHYPKIAGLVLDAIFDDILPFAQRRMPTSLSHFVEKTIRSYFDLNNIPLLRLYQGPFYLIRRTKDEIISLIPRDLSTNRANEILYQILPYRYPWIYPDEESLCLLRKYLSMSNDERHIAYPIDRETIEKQLQDYQNSDPEPFYPSRFGESLSMLDRQTWGLYLIDEYLIDFHGEHGRFLPGSSFHLPRRFL